MPFPSKRPDTPKPNSKPPAQRPIKRGPEGVTIMGQPTYSQEFLRKVRLFEKLCFNLDLVPPRIVPAKEEDACDVTELEEVRLKNYPSDMMDWEYQVRHVFAHWLCDLHSGGYSNHSKEEEERADKIADIIASLIYGYGRANTGRVLL